MGTECAISADLRQVPQSVLEQTPTSEETEGAIMGGCSWWPSDALGPLQSSNPQAQGDGDPAVWDLGTMPASFQFLRGQCRLVHVEKSGPAFAAVQQLDGNTVVYDAAVVQADALQCAGEVLNALTRGCFLDVARSWPRLLAIVGVKSLGARVTLRKGWAWAEMRDAVTLALCYSRHPESLEWQKADSLLRAYAREAAESAESRSESEVGAQNLDVFRANLATYKAFTEGRL